MSETWRVLRDYPQYEINEEGQVRTIDTELLRQVTLNQYGAPKLNLMQEGEVKTVALNHLMAIAYLDPPPREDFNTVIHLNGDREDCRKENLMWRPRHFAIKYHQQFQYQGFIHSHIRVQDIKTERIYNRAQEAVMEHGILFQHILISIHQNTYVWPTYQYFRHPVLVGYNQA